MLFPVRVKGLQNVEENNDQELVYSLKLMGIIRYNDTKMIFAFLRLRGSGTSQLSPSAIWQFNGYAHDAEFDPECPCAKYRSATWAFVRDVGFGVRSDKS